MFQKLFLVFMFSMSIFRVFGQSSKEGKTVVDLVKEAKAKIENLTPAQVMAEINQGAVLIDVREPEEMKNGVIAGAVNAPRGMLEFFADQNTPYHMHVFEKDKRIILHCASGGRSALAAATLREMGYSNVAHLEGGIRAWKEAGLAVK